ncbi:MULTISPECIES: hypothetical protein [unclassified Sphingopyxis]|uniref:hypothetical protein n=1 Tax=unclassified Sphingopyxis TaxID=2614943 RepID=UPI00073066CC|nr:MULTISPECIES: hypothetical protein [unclassified Sphingopyxis]KTE27887.1 hypothetical protein ATE61_00720 [Sphingopyxis sp. H057]KTE55732.1 hypothetical protein ATE64_02195 [Sphingopyxis sp. H073]KTE57387.1 hypothetical protein ATE69_00720 [Sphingopyxis sp. H071]KTE61473.1 hypothetical protein ATE66_05200 [Sphingopyxis sp. H107]KTE65196.1 hypothetical protein ATE65_09530 [Sphingopyxis sp. H100]
MMVRGKWLVAGLLIATAPLAGCRDNPDAKADLKPLDDGLTDADPAVKGALEDKIMVDPKLTGQANRNAAGPGNRPVDGGAPGIAAGKAATAAEAAAALKAGKLLQAPKALAFEENCGADCDAKRPVTIGALARDQQKGSCDAKLTYGNQWANRLPAAFKLYPRATLREAAGVAGGKCNIRVVNFQTAASIQGVLDYYHTMAIRAGYTSDHRVRGNEHMLGGTKGDLAYVVMLRRDGGMTDVDLVASGGQ